MKVWMLFAFGSVMAACSNGSPPMTHCEALQACCDSLPNGTGASCAQWKGVTDESTCSSALLALQQASYCKDVAGGPTPSSGGGCDRYLSCLLASQPEAYGAAVQLYGKGSACWANDAQSAGCNQACDASYDKIADLCVCEGASCMKCAAPASGTYRPKSTSPGLPGSCGGQSIEIQNANLIVAAGRIGSMQLYYYAPFGSGTITLTGPLECSGASTLTGSDTTGGFGCSVVVTATVSAGPVDRSIVLDGTWKQSCGGQPAETCSQSFTLYQ
jgi:hypothetical protein